MYYDSVQPRSLRLFDALLLHADEHEKAALLSIIDDKPHRNDLRDVPQLSTARQLMELLEFLAKNADEQSRGDFPAKADILRARIVMRGDVDMDRARHKCAGAAIHAILGRIAKDPAAAFSGILFDKVLRTRSPIPRELILNAEVYWTGDDNACLRCVGGSFVYTFQFVEVEVETPRNSSKLTISRRRKGDIPAENFEQRLRRMTELVEEGMKRQLAAFVTKASRPLLSDS